MTNQEDKHMELPQSFVVGEKVITVCQARVISLGALGLQRKKIAHYLGISKHTIDSHMDRIYKLLGINDGRQLVVWALANGFDGSGNLKEHYLFSDFGEMPWHDKCA